MAMTRKDRWVGTRTRMYFVGSRKQHVPVWVEDMCAAVEASINRADQPKPF